MMYICTDLFYLFDPDLTTLLYGLECLCAVGPCLVVLRALYGGQVVRLTLLE